MSPTAWVMEHEAALRLGSFLAVLGALAIAERVWPARGDARPAPRQITNLGLMLINTGLLRLLFPVLAVAVAMSVHSRGGGLFGLLGLPGWLEVLATVVVMDAAIYAQHRLMHAVPLLWRMHRVHHTDLGFDVTLGVRFHPLEMAFSMGVKLGLVYLLGAPALGVVAFEILLAAASLFTHADFAFPARAEPWLRAAVVTPSMHRTHHSVLRHETDSNYGFLLSAWDRIFGSYTPRPLRPEREMPIGLSEWRTPDRLGLPSLLLQPFRAAPVAGPEPAPSAAKETPDA
ncbi:sterol desaturase family protein [Novilysobacter antarcticus]|uniref:sterol desaturase family protein n=1 Tax=Novilysobacter antarcticus TaxID=2862543 RepID=UPI001FEAFAE9|nr:sterol desaturase family protein [Lysobacter antarcticus]